MTREQFAALAAQIAGEKPDYKEGGDGSKGVCDCVGLCIGALRRGGIAYDRTHGSNWAARYESVELWEIRSVSELRVGDSVLKARHPGDAGYDLPDYYRDHPDQRDYYHIGVLTSVDPLEITHMTSPTIKVDTKLGQWKYAFLWKQLQQDETDKEESKMQAYQAKVKLGRPDLEGNGLVVRPAPGSSDEIDKLEHGRVVTVQAVSGAYALVSFEGGPSGYVTKKYLERIETLDEQEKAPDEETAAQTGRVAMVITDEAGHVFIPEGAIRVEMREIED